MQKFALAAAIIVAFGLPALAQTPSEVTKPNNDATLPATRIPSAAPATGKTFSVATSTIGELLDNPAAKAIFQKYLPTLVANPQMDLGRAMHRPDIVQYAPEITPEILASIDGDLKALPPQ